MCLAILLLFYAIISWPMIVVALLSVIKKGQFILHRPYNSYILYEMNYPCALRHYLMK